MTMVLALRRPLSEAQLRELAALGMYVLQARGLQVEFTGAPDDLVKGKALLRKKHLI